MPDWWFSPFLLFINYLSGNLRDLSSTWLSYGQSSDTDYLSGVVTLTPGAHVLVRIGAVHDVW